MQKKEELTIGLIQTSIRDMEPLKNLELIQKIICQTSKLPDLAFLPEMAFTGFLETPQPSDDAVSEHILAELRKLVEEHNIALCTSVVKKEDDSYFNRLFFLAPQGQSWQYDKRHLFSPGKENECYSQGNQRIVVEYLGWKILPLICYDLRFPVWSANHGEYDLLAYIANWPLQRSTHWEALLKARAIENLCYTLGVNRVGTDPAGNTYKGDSMLFSPWGQMICRTRQFVEEIRFASISMPELEHYRKVFPVLNDQDSYSLHTGKKMTD